MVSLKISYTVLLLAALSCTHKMGKIDHPGGYPPEVSSIIFRSCAVKGCHNETSKDAAAGLSLSTWESLFKGGRNGQVVIPYRPDYSTLCFYTNTFSDLGPALNPIMPIGGNPLSREEFMTLKQWILEGAYNSDKFVMFSDHSSRSKIYITNQLCDLVMVLDASTKKIMRCVDVGSSPKQEFPVCIAVSPDKKHWYSSFMASDQLQKFDAATDKFIAQVSLGPGIWSTFAITSDSKLAFCVDNSSQGKITRVDLTEMVITDRYSGPNLFYPRGIAIDEPSGKLYVGNETGNYVSVLSYTNFIEPTIKQVVLDGSGLVSQHSINDPICLQINTQLRHCYVACRNSGDIKVLSLDSDSVICNIPLNSEPFFIAEIPGKNLLVVSCTNDSLSFAGTIGSVKFIDLKQKKVIKTLNSGFQPSGLCVNTLNNYLAVINSNTNPKGPRPHHTSACSGRNGYVSYVDLNTLEMIPAVKQELAVYPYATALR